MVARKQQSVAGRLFVIVLVGAVLLLLVPLIIPISDAEGVDPQLLASDDSEFMEINGVEVHYLQRGAGRDIVLIHGDGGGTFTWEAALPELADLGTTTAYDRTGYGISERPVADSGTVENPYDSGSHFRQLIGLLEALEIDRFTVIGHGEGANLAVRVARALPEQVTALVLEAPVIEAADTSVVSHLRPLLRSPQIRHLAPLYVRRSVDSLVFDVDGAYFSPAKITPELREAYSVQTTAINWDRALWENHVAPPLPDLTGELSRIEAPVLVVAGAGDTIVPLTRAEAIADAIGADLETIGACGHIVHEECPNEFMAAVIPWLTSHGS